MTPPHSTNAHGGGAKILVVEDHRLVALDIQRTLSEIGYSVVGSASAGEEAVRKARAVLPDLVLMDIHLCGAMDGIEAAGAIQKEMRIPVVYLSAYSDPKTVRRARKSAPFGYLVKPFNQAELICAVEAALGRWMMDQRALERQVVSRATEEHSSSRLRELLGEALLVGKAELPGSADMPKPATRLDPHEVELPSGPALITSRTLTGSVIVLPSGDFAARPAGPRADDAGGPGGRREAEAERPVTAEGTAGRQASPDERPAARDSPALACAEGLAADFGDVLSTILANAQLLLDELPADGRREEVESIHTAASRAAELTKRLRALGRG